VILPGRASTGLAAKIARSSGNWLTPAGDVGLTIGLILGGAMTAPRPTGRGAVARPWDLSDSRPVGYVFLSYTRADQAYIERLAAQAEQRGIAVWFDSDIESGERWLDIIEAKVRSCAAFAPLVTPASLESDWCRRELLLADQLGKPVLALVQQGTTVPMQLVDRQYETVAAGQLPAGRWFDTLAGTALASSAEGASTTTSSSPSSSPEARELDLRLIGEGAGLLRRSQLDRFFDLVEKRLILAEPLDADVRLSIRMNLETAAFFASKRQRRRADGLQRQLEDGPGYGQRA